MEADGNFHGEKKEEKKKSVTLQNCNVRSLVSMLIPIYVLLNAEKFRAITKKYGERVEPTRFPPPRKRQ